MAVCSGRSRAICFSRQRARRASSRCRSSFAGRVCRQLGAVGPLVAKVARSLRGTGFRARHRGARGRLAPRVGTGLVRRSESDVPSLSLASFSQLRGAFRRAKARLWAQRGRTPDAYGYNAAKWLAIEAGVKAGDGKYGWNDVGIDE